jgi:hypothetical protein
VRVATFYDLAGIPIEAITARRKRLERQAASITEFGFRLLSSKPGKALMREETIVGRPIMELLAAGGQQARDGMPSQAEQTA